jgi:hypothetical protein
MLSLNNQVSWLTPYTDDGGRSAAGGHDAGGCPAALSLGHEGSVLQQVPGPLLITSSVGAPLCSKLRPPACACCERHRWDCAVRALSCTRRAIRHLGDATPLQRVMPSPAQAHILALYEPTPWRCLQSEPPDTWGDGM